MVKELLEHPESYEVRALTRSPSKPAAQALAKLGVELYCADLTSGRDALASAFSGADVVFALTDFWQTQSKDDEIAQGKAIADAAAETRTLKNFIWSALPDPVKLSGGLFLNVHHWKGKSLITEYIQASKPELWAKTTTILFPNYFENCLTIPDRYLPVKVSAEPSISFQFHNYISPGFLTYLPHIGCFWGLHSYVPTQPRNCDAQCRYFRYRQACAYYH